MTPPSTNHPDVLGSLRVLRRASTTIVEFTGGHETNHFSIHRMAELRDVLDAIALHDDVSSVILYGGDGRDFSVGGDFHETAQFSGGEEVDEWIEQVGALYRTILRIPMPTIAAVHGYAIGIGLQIALCCDYRIATNNAALMMPEFRVGVACNFGGFLLTEIVGRSVMEAMIFSCDTWDSKRALRDGLIHEVVKGNVLERALAHAQAMERFNPVAVRTTKPQLNAPLIASLDRVTTMAKESHRMAFSSGFPQRSMLQILRGQHSLG